MNKLVLKEINRYKRNNIIKTCIAFTVVLMLLSGMLAKIVSGFVSVIISV